MINDVLLRWGVTGLFVLSAAVWGFAMVTQRRAWTSAVRNGLHFVMAIAMAVMVGHGARSRPRRGLRCLPAGHSVVRDHDHCRGPNDGPAGGMRVSRPDDAGDGLDVCRHEASPLPQPFGHAPSDIAGYADARHGRGCDRHGGESHEWVSALNWFWFVGFAVAAVLWAYRFTTERR